MEPPAVRRKTEFHSSSIGVQRVFLGGPRNPHATGGKTEAPRGTLRLQAVESGWLSGGPDHRVHGSPHDVG